MTRQFSNDVKDLLVSTKKIAERLENNYIGVPHFLLCLNAFNKKGRLQIQITLSEKKDLINSIKGKKLEHRIKGDYPLTKQLEVGLKSSGFHCWIMGDKMIMPEHIFLGNAAYLRENKPYYLELLKNAGIHINRIKYLLIELYFSKIVRKVGLLWLFH